MDKFYEAADSLQQLVVRLNINKSSDVDMRQANIGVVNQFYVQPSLILPQEVVFNYAPEVGLAEMYNSLRDANHDHGQELRIENNDLITEKIIENMSEFHRISLGVDRKPLLRIYAYFSSLSTVRSASDPLRTARLEYEESKHLKKLLLSGYKIKVIFSLDIADVLGKGYPESNVRDRIVDLCDTLDYACIHELPFAFEIDKHHYLETQYIWDNFLLMIAPFYKKHVGYEGALFTSNPKKVSIAVQNFDARFYILYQERIMTRYHKGFAEDMPSARILDYMNTLAN